MHQVEVRVVPLVVGALGIVPKYFAKWQEYLGIPDIVGSIQMSALLATTQLSLEMCYISELREGAEI